MQKKIVLRTISRENLFIDSGILGREPHPISGSSVQNRKGDTFTTKKIYIDVPDNAIIWEVKFSTNGNKPDYIKFKQADGNSVSDSRTEECKECPYWRQENEIR